MSAPKSCQPSGAGNINLRLKSSKLFGHQYENSGFSFVFGMVSMLPCIVHQQHDRMISEIIFSTFSVLFESVIIINLTIKRSTE